MIIACLITWFWTKYHRSIIYSPALVDVHCIMSVKCAGIINLKARKNDTQVYNDLSNIYRKVFVVLKQFLYCVERFCIVLSVLGNITNVWPSTWFSTTKLFNIIEIDKYFTHDFIHRSFWRLSLLNVYMYIIRI